MRGLNDDNAYERSSFHQFDWSEPLAVVAGIIGVGLIIMIGWLVWQNTPSPLVSGEVVDRRFTAQYEEDHDGGTTCWSRDKNGFCTFSTQNPDIHHTHCIGGCYELRISGCSNDRQGDEHCREEWITVTQGDYEICVVGRTWRQATSCRPQ